ncbi:MAG: nucleotidyltransferase [Leptolyngbya sp. ERB_1_1]
MRRDEVIAIVTAHQDELKSMGVESIDLFGSVARDEATPESDVDFLVELNRPMGLFDFVGIKLYLEDILGRDVDLGSLDALRESLREPVIKDVVRVF